MVAKPTIPPMTMAMKQSVIFSRHACLELASVMPIILSKGEGAQNVTIHDVTVHQSSLDPDA
jgi:hypothetical protein